MFVHMSVSLELQHVNVLLERRNGFLCKEPLCHFRTWSIEDVPSSHLVSSSIASFFWEIDKKILFTSTKYGRSIKIAYLLTIPPNFSLCTSQENRKRTKLKIQIRTRRILLLRIQTQILQAQTQIQAQIPIRAQNLGHQNPIRVREDHRAIPFPYRPNCPRHTDRQTVHPAARLCGLYYHAAIRT